MDRVSSSFLLVALLAAAPALGGPRRPSADPVVGFTLASSSVVEDAGAAGVEVVLSGPAAADVTIPFTVGGSAGTADVSLPVGPLVIPAGQSSGSIDLTLLDDALSEGRERVVLTLEAPIGGQLGTDTVHELVIDDDEPAATIAFEASAGSATESEGLVSIALALSDARTEDATVEFALTGSATSGGVDFDIVGSGPIVIPQGATSATLEVSITADGVDELDEDLVVSLLGGGNCELGWQAAHTLTIVDEDDPPAVQFTAFRTGVAEQSGGFSVRVELDTVSGLEVTVPFTVSGNAAGSEDLSYPPAPLSIPAGATHADLPVTLVVDQVVEIGDRVLFTLEDPDNAVLGSITTHLVGIEDVRGGAAAALGAPLTASVSALAFPLTRLGDASPPQTVFLSNLSSAAVTLTGLETFGADAGDFDLTITGALPALIAPGESVGVDVIFQPQGRGERRARFRSRQARQGAAPPLITLTGSGIGPTGAEIRMDTTSSGSVSPSGTEWSPEYGATNGFLETFDFDVAGTDHESLYRSIRYGPDFSYALEVPSGAYEVVLLACEPGKTAAGQRVFDVSLEGQVALDDLDLFAESGRRAAYASPPLPVTVTDGVLDIHFEGVLDAAVVCALEVRSVAVLTSATTSLQFGTVDQDDSLTRDVEFRNEGLHTATLDRLTFRVGTEGDGADFSVTWAGVTYAGDTDTVVRFPGIEVPPGVTAVPVTFAPTAHADHEIALEFEASAGGDVFEITALGSGGAQAGWGFLHPVPDFEPRFVVDYDQDGAEMVTLLGGESHTHEPGRSLILHEWSVDGAVVGTAVDVAQALPVGSNSVSLTIGDDGDPQSFATDARTIPVHPVDEVPGVLVRYYDGSAIGELALLDAVPATAVHVSREAQFAVQRGDGTVGDSPFTERVMLTMVGQFQLLAERDLELAPSGGAGHRIFLDGQPAGGVQSLGAGLHTVEARFAVTSLSDLPVCVQVLEGGVPATGLESSLFHDERFVKPVIHEMPTIGTDLGGNRIVIEGFGFFPESSTVVHWGSTDIASGQFDEWGGDSITLTTPPGTGTVQVTVETPNGVSNTVDFSYSPSGPIPIRFDLLSDREVSLSAVTAGAFGPDGRLYVARLSGEIHVVTFDEDYNAISVETKSGVSGLTNGDTLSLAFNPFDVFDPQDPTSLRLYVGHGEQFQNGGGAFTGPSYFTGQVSVLAGPDFDSPEAVITHLPVSNHDHSIDGMTFDENGDLLLSVGGTTNAGVEWPLLGDVPESPLSGAILRASISRPGFNGAIQYVDSVTQAPVVDQVLGGGVDVVDGVDVEVLASGMRHAYDLVLHTNGYLYSTDNGPNSGYGPASTGLVTDAGPVHPYEDDELNLVEFGLYYGSANRARGRYDERQLMYRSPSEPSIPGCYRRPITRLDSSTNGIDEYRATTFNSAMRGDLIAMKWNAGVYRIGLSADGREVLDQTLHSNGNDQSHLPNRGLDVLAGPGGAIVAVDFSLGKVRVQVPNDVAALGLTPYDIFPWRAPASGGQPFVIGGDGFLQSLQSVSVSIGGVAASVTAVSDKRIEGILPPSPTGLATDLLDVVVSVGVTQRTIPNAFRYLPAVPGEGRGVWRPGAALPAELGDVACVILGSEILAFGAGDARTFGLDVHQGVWSTGRAQRPFPGGSHGVEVIGERVYLFGGVGGGSAGQVQIYDVTTDSWASGAPMPWGAGACATAVVDGIVYVGGGRLQGAGTAANFASYDPATDSWTPLGVMPIAVDHASAGTDGMRVFVFGGGQSANGSQVTVNDVQVFDPSAGTWSTSAAGEVHSMPLPRAGAGRAVYTQGEFHVAGGADGVGAFADVQVYDPAANSWRMDRPLPTAREGISPVGFEGRVFVVGGNLAGGSVFTSVAEVFSPR